MGIEIHQLRRWWPVLAISALLCTTVAWFAQASQPAQLTVQPLPSVQDPAPQQLAEPWEDTELQQRMTTRVRYFTRAWHGKQFQLDDLRSNLRNDKTRLMLLVGIIDQRVYLEGTAKSNAILQSKLWGWYTQLTEALQWLSARGLHVPNCMFTMHLVSMPRHRRATPPAAPSLALANSDEHAEVPMPNPYFLTPGVWGEIRHKLRELAKQQPFHNRTTLAFYRGSCSAYPGSLPRVELAVINDTVLDVGIVGRCDNGSWSKAIPAHREMLTKARVASFAKFHQYVRHKYLVHMPGAAKGSYSRNLQFMLGLGAVVLVWDHPYYEFYYDWLEEDKHYVAVNASNIVSKVRRLNANLDRAARIARNTAVWFDKHLHADFLQQYWWTLLTELAGLQGFEPSLEHLSKPCTCRYAYPEYEGEECDVCRDKPAQFQVGFRR